MVVPLLLNDYGPIRSVIDVGCGIGPWLAEFMAHGVDTVTGLDGPHVDAEQLLIPPGSFIQHDLSTPIDLPDTYDLCISLEVAEHLPQTRTDGFVTDLCSLSRLILFSAAVPGQGGRGHVNERWQSDWIRRFADHGYGVHDVVRPRIWNDPTVPYWYRQNVFIFEQGTGTEVPIADVIHPGMLDSRADWRPPTSFVGALKELPGLAASGIQRRMHRRSRRG